MYRSHTTPTKRRASFDEELELACASVGRESAKKHDGWDEDHGYHGDVSGCDYEMQPTRDRTGFLHRCREPVEDGCDVEGQVASSSDEEVDVAAASIEKPGRIGRARIEDGQVEEYQRVHAAEHPLLEDRPGVDSSTSGSVGSQNGNPEETRQPWCPLCNAMTRNDCLCDLSENSSSLSPCDSCSYCAFCSLERGGFNPIRQCHEFTCSDHFHALVERYYGCDRMDMGPGTNNPEEELISEQGDVDTATSRTQTTGAIEHLAPAQVEAQMSQALVEFDGRIVVLHSKDFHAIVVPTWAGLKECVAGDVGVAMKKGLVHGMYRLIRLGLKLAQWEQRDLNRS